MSGVSRRNFLHAASLTSAGAMASRATAADEASPRISPASSPTRSDSIRCISSANGLETTKLAYNQIAAGGRPVDAVVAGVALVEDDENDTSVGYGGLPNERGIVELDAAVMDGPSHSAGAVASIRNIRHPAQVALKVLRRTDHVLLVGPGALDFARAHGFREENLLTDKARRIWLHWKENLSREDDWLGEGEADEDVAAFIRSRTQMLADARGNVRPRFVRPTGTIHCSAVTTSGDVACTTTTSGLAFKIPGRVGDSPIIGAGLYCDNNVGSCGSTGRGEANLQNMCSFAAVELMRQGASPLEAGMEILERVAATSPARLKGKNGQPNFGLNFYVLAKDGRYAGVSMQPGQKFAVTDKQGTRLEPCVSLIKG